MQTIILEAPGCLMAADRPEPLIEPGNVLVRVHRIGVCGTDIHALAGRQPLFTYPRVLGHELGVEVVDPGQGESGLKAGDRCTVEPYLNCGHCHACRRGLPNCCETLKVMGVHVDGGMRSLMAVPARKLHCVPHFSFDQLALVETLAIGAHAVERAQVLRSDFVAVIGAGPIGFGVAQFAAATGARVVLIDTNDSRLAMAESRVGIADTVNPNNGEIKVQLHALAGELPTVVFDATGSARSMEAAFELPAHGGRLIFVGLTQSRVGFDDPSFHRRELTVMGSRNATAKTFATVIHAIESGQVDTSQWITHRLTLADVPSGLPGIVGESGLLKAMISVP